MCVYSLVTQLTVWAMELNLVITTVLVLIGLPRIYCYNILVLFPHSGKSHFDSYVGLFKALAKKGHNVTVISHFSLQEPITNYRDIEIGGLEKFANTSTSSYRDLGVLEAKSRLSKYYLPLVLAEQAQLACEVGFSSKSVKSFLEERNHFDVAIVEHFNSDCFLTMVKKFGIPVVRAHSCKPMPWTSNRYGNPNNPAHMPNHFMHFSQKMTFFERVENTMLSLYHSAFYNFVLMTNDRTVSMKYFGDLGATIHNDILNDSLLLLNTHYSLNLPVALVPNIIAVGGIHIGKSKALSKVC